MLYKANIKPKYKSMKDYISTLDLNFFNTPNLDLAKRSSTLSIHTRGHNKQPTSNSDPKS